MTRYDRLLPFALGVASAAVGCGSGSVNQAKLTDVQAAVRAAEEVGAQEIPDAQLHLKLANDQIAKAEELYRKDEADAGFRMLDRAEADAELALAIAQAQEVREEAREAEEKIRELKQKGR